MNSRSFQQSLEDAYVALGLMSGDLPKLPIYSSDTWPIAAALRAGGLQSSVEDGLILFVASVGGARISVVVGVSRMLPCKIGSPWSCLHRMSILPVPRSQRPTPTHNL